MLVTTGERHCTCPSCGKTYTKSKKLKVNMSANINEWPYSCQTCEKAFTQPAYLRRHLFTHTGDCPHKCPFCGECHTRSSSLKIHVLTHTGKRPFKCSSSKKGFICSSSLNVHLLTHNGERPHKYICHTCNDSFKYWETLVSHVNRHWVWNILAMNAINPIQASVTYPTTDVHTRPNTRVLILTSLTEIRRSWHRI